MKLSTRLIFIFKNFVIKIPIDKRGYLQGKNEKKLWDKYSHTKHLGELYWEKFGIVCMKKYNVCKYRIPLYIVDEIKNDIKELNVKNCDLHNYKNWAIKVTKFHATYVLIDYGINETISKMY